MSQLSLQVQYLDPETTQEKREFTPEFWGNNQCSRELWAFRKRCCSFPHTRGERKNQSAALKGKLQTPKTEIQGSIKTQRIPDPSRASLLLGHPQLGPPDLRGWNKLVPDVLFLSFFCL